MKRRGKYFRVCSTWVGRAVIASQRKAPMNSQRLSVLSFCRAHVLSRQTAIKVLYFRFGGFVSVSSSFQYVQLMFYLGKTLFTLGITLRLRCVRIRHFKSVHGIRCCYHSNETSMETCVASVLKFIEARANEIKDPFRSFPQRTCAETLARQATFLADLLDGTSLCYRNVAFL